MFSLLTRCPKFSQEQEQKPEANPSASTRLEFRIISYK